MPNGILSLGSCLAYAKSGVFQRREDIKNSVYGALGMKRLFRAPSSTQTRKIITLGELYVS